MKAFFTQFRMSLRDSLRIWWLAPIIPAISVIPEFAQHITEIDLGMFVSKDAAKDLADDPTRWAFGYVKLAGLLLAILASIRFWAASEQGNHWWDVRLIAWNTLGLAIVVIALTAIPDLFLSPLLGETAAQMMSVGLSIITLPLLILLVAGLAGNRQISLRSVFTKGWIPAIKMILFLAVIWAPLQWLHGQNHELAFGASSGAVWALMIFDSVVVGVMATYAGSAIFHAYKSMSPEQIQDAGQETARA